MAWVSEAGVKPLSELYQPLELPRSPVLLEVHFSVSTPYDHSAHYRVWRHGLRTRRQAPHGVGFRTADRPRYREQPTPPYGLS